MMKPTEMTERTVEVDEIGSLIADLTSEDGPSRVRARRQLARIGPPAVPFLTELLEDDRWRVRLEAAKTLEAIASPASAPALTRALGDKSSSVRWVAAEALVALGPCALEDLLHEMIRQSVSTRIRRAAHHVLLEIRQEPARTFLAPLLKALGEPRGSGREILEAHRCLDRLHALCSCD